MLLGYNYVLLFIITEDICLKSKTLFYIEKEGELKLHFRNKYIAN